MPEIAQGVGEAVGTGRALGLATVGTLQKWALNYAGFTARRRRRQGKLNLWNKRKRTIRRK